MYWWTMACEFTDHTRYVSARFEILCILVFFFIRCHNVRIFFFFFNDTAPTDIYPLSLHDALPISDLTLSGDVTFSNRPPLLEQTIQSVTSRWLRCQLMTPITPATAPVEGKVRASQLPTITAVGDRKSTRLNSSHSQISYAVFCLKK